MASGMKFRPVTSNNANLWKMRCGFQQRLSADVGKQTGEQGSHTYIHTWYCFP
jgi:hypothetical protein